MKTIKIFSLCAAFALLMPSCRYTHGESNDSTEESATQTMAEGQGGETSEDTTTSADIQQTIPQDSTKSSQPQPDVMRREKNGAGDNNSK